MSNFLDTVFMIDSEVVDFIDLIFVKFNGASYCTAYMAGLALMGSLIA